ncbi:MAG: P-type conjugative transfer protein TrbG [Caulobacter sp.]|nr:P-type conjugative transfer protein TrbG [Caulobacter sp.]
MDARRLLSLAVAGLLLSGCAILKGERPDLSSATAAAKPTAAAVGAATPPSPPFVATASTSASGFGVMAPIPNPPERRVQRAAAPAPVRAVASRAAARSAPPAAVGRAAIAAANAEAREASRSDSFVGGMQVFSYAPGRVFEVWTAPLRVTTLTLGPGETVTAKAAGDTVRWQIGETTSGAGPSQRAHVLIKPLERNLETNLVLTTNQRVYLIQLKSGPPETFNAAVAWDLGALAQPTSAAAAAERVADALVTPSGPLDARYRIAPQGRRPKWSPTAVMSDGVRTFITFPPELQIDEAPALFVIAADGEAQMVNYRQQGGLMVVDRVFDRAELRLGGKRGQVVRITRLAGGRA